jgi:hypothetical protein
MSWLASWARGVVVAGWGAVLPRLSLPARVAVQTLGQGAASLPFRTAGQTDAQFLIDSGA